MEKTGRTRTAGRPIPHAAGADGLSINELIRSLNLKTGVVANHVKPTILWQRQGGLPSAEHRGPTVWHPIAGVIFTTDRPAALGGHVSRNGVGGLEGTGPGYRPHRTWVLLLVARTPDAMRDRERELNGKPEQV